MRFALISDIHSNIEALTAVFADIDRLGIQRVICLGDVVGYGPDPEPCVDLIMKRCEFCIRGNHDDAIFNSADRFNPYARSAINWTRERLRPGLFKPRANSARWKYLETLGLERRIDDMYFVHGSPRDPVNEYIYAMDVGYHETKIRQIFSVVDRVLFVGHTHQPMVVSDQRRSDIPTESHAEFRLEAGKFIVNVGSVGQPRDRNNKACWVEVDDKVLKFHRVAYDIEAVVAKIARIPELDEILATRLRDGM